MPSAIAPLNVDMWSQDIGGYVADEKRRLGQVKIPPDVTGVASALRASCRRGRSGTAIHFPDNQRLLHAHIR
jgi:hypothetical protein